MIFISDLFRHPVKSLGAERLTQMALKAGRAAPFDRMYAIAHGDSAFNPQAPAWTPCENFLRVTHIPVFATLDVNYDPQTYMFRAASEALGEVEVDLSLSRGKEALAAWVAPHASVVAGPFSVAQVPRVALADSPIQAVSIKSRASLRALGEHLGAELDPRRFRGNIWLDGDIEPWAEFNWINRELRLGGARLRVIEPISRCLAPAASPQSGKRDLIPTRALSEHYNHTRFGVLAEILEDGEITLEDQMEVL